MKKQIVSTALILLLGTAVSFAQAPLKNGLSNGLANGMQNGLANGMQNGLKDGTKEGLKESTKEGLKNGHQKKSSPTRRGHKTGTKTH